MISWYSTREISPRHVKPLLFIGFVGWMLLLGGIGFSDTVSLSQPSGAPEHPTQAYPRKPIKVIVPFGAGGGSDTFSRIIQKAFDDHQLLPEPLVIINVPGAGGTIGSRRLKNSRPDGYTIMQLHEAILTSKYTQRAPYGPEAFEPIAATGQSALTICVADDSPVRSLRELIELATERPDEIIYSANIGAPSQFAGLMLERAAPGAEFRYVQAGDGAKRFAGLQGGHTHVSAFSMAEYFQFKPSGLRALAVFSAERHPDAPDVPTAREEGYDVTSLNMHFWWAPKGTPQDRLSVIAEALEQAMQTDEVRERLAQLRTDPIFLSGDRLTTELGDRSARIAAVAQRQTVPLPDFPLIVLSIAGLLAALVGIQSWTRQGEELPESDQPNTPSTPVRSLGIAVVILVSTILYVAAMQFEFLGFRVATALFVAGTGLLLSGIGRRAVGVMATLSLTMSLGLHYLFTNLFVIDLP